MNENPYQTPAVQDYVVPVLNEAEEIRTKHLKHEASIKAVGFLYFLGAVLVALSLVGVGFAAFYSGSGPGGPELGIFALLFVVCVAQFFAGWGLRKLRPWSKVPAGIVAAVSLISIPIGTIFGLYFLYLIFSAKGRTILSPGYQDIVAQTPHLRYRTPIWIWILLLVALLGFIALIFFGSAVPR